MDSKIKSFLFQNTSTGQTIAKNTFWLGASNVGSRLIKLILMVYAARILGTSGYGVFSYALGLSILFSVLSDIGINSLTTREVSSSDKPHQKFIATSLMIRLVLIIISILAIILIAPLFTKIPEVIPLLPVIAILIALDSMRNFALAINRGEQKMEIEAVVLIVTNVTIVVVGIITLIAFATSRALTAAYAIGTGVGLIIALAILRRHFRNILRYFDRRMVKDIIKNAWPFALLGLSGVIMINTDLVMIGALRGASEVGLYSAAQKPIQVLYSIPVMIASAFFPAITKFVNKDNKKLGRVMEKTIAATLLVGMPIAFGGIILGKQIIGFLFGGAYISATFAFQILLLTVLITFPSAVVAHAIFAYNKPKNFIWFLVFGVIGNIFLNILLIPKYGIVGSAFATIGAELAANSFIWFRMRKINPFSVLPHTKKIITATALMTVLAIFIQIMGVNPLINIILSASAYFGFLKVLKEPLLVLKTAKDPGGSNKLLLPDTD